MPRALLGAPRRSSLIPNASGTHGIFTQSSYSFESHSQTNEIRVVNVSDFRDTLITNDSGASDPQWLDSSSGHLIWLKSKGNGNTSLVIGEAYGAGETYTAGTISGPVTNLKITKLENGNIGFAVTGKANPDGTLFNPRDVQEPHSSGKLYTSLFVRHWDAYVEPQKNTIWYGVLEQAPLSAASKRAGKFSVSSGLTNLIAVCGLDGVESPIPPFGGSEDFAISPAAIAFVAKDPEVNPATHTTCSCYYCPIFNWTSTTTGAQAVRFRKMTTGLNGAMSSPTLSSDGSSLAVLVMREDGYESDKNRIVYVPNPWSGEMVEIFRSLDGEGQWDLSPSSLSFAHDQAFLIQVQEKGRVVLYRLPLENVESATPAALEKLTHSRSVTDAFAAEKSGRLFVSQSSLVDDSVWMILNPTNPGDVKISFSNSCEGTNFGLSASQVEELWFAGADDIPVHAWVVKPCQFDPNGKYPLAYLIHGGPQAAWNDQWSTRWNPAVFAEQGEFGGDVKER